MFHKPLCHCPLDTEWHEYDVWGKLGGEGSLEGAEDGDAY